MCGIAGYLNLGDNTNGSRDILSRMINEIAHRGPDAQGYLVNEIGGLGFCRLSIIDIEGESQPFSNEDSSVLVVGNGEIFGYREIRKDLIKRGHKLRTQCDIEVLVHLYEERGTKFFKELRGQFAFVIIDVKKQEFYLIRDHFGVCPLFYTIKNQQIIFASEIKAILQYPSIERNINIAAVEQFFSLPGLANPNTMFKDIYSVPPGHYIYANKRGRCEVIEYWDVEFPKNIDGAYKESKDIVLDELEELLTKSVCECLEHSDVEVGALLSGGLDSSLINALLSRISSTKRRTFSVTLDVSEYNESNYQEIVTKETGFYNNKINFNTDDILEHIKKVIWYSECPIKETVNVALYKLSSIIRSNNMKVVLSGEGSDEIFAGYLGYLGDIMVMNARKRSVDERYICTRLWGDEMFKYDIDYIENNEFKKSIFSEQFFEQCKEFDFIKKPVVNLEKIRGIHPVNRRSYLDLKLRLPELLLLNQHDHMFAANGVEARYPFLNVDLVEYCAKIHPNLKIRGTKQKYILKEIGKKYLPNAITKRNKFPFVTPGTPHILQKNPEFIKSILSRDTIIRQGYFNYDTIEKLIDEYTNNNTNVHINYQSDVLFQLISFTLFIDTFRISNK